MHPYDTSHYRLYRVRRHELEPVLLATSPDAGGIGCAIATLTMDGDIQPDDRIGIISPDRKWILNPFGGNQ